MPDTMTTARRFVVAGLVTLSMPVVIVGGPALASAGNVGGTDQATHHYAGTR